MKLITKFSLVREKKDLNQNNVGIIQIVSKDLHDFSGQKMKIVTIVLESKDYVNVRELKEYLIKMIQENKERVNTLKE